MEEPLDGIGSDGPWSAWRLIDAARTRRLSGALVLDLEPRVVVYFDDGAIYFAERSTDRDVTTRLIAEGLLTQAQAAAGTVRLRGVEHVGRLFERVEGIDRGAVEFCVEQFTDEVLMAIAHRAVARYEVQPYVRQRNGIDRWSTRRQVDEHIDEPVDDDTPVAVGHLDVESDDDRTEPIDRDTARAVEPTGRVRVVEHSDTGAASRRDGPPIVAAGQTTPLVIVNPSTPVALVPAAITSRHVPPEVPPIPIVADPEPAVTGPPTLSIVGSDPTPVNGAGEVPIDAIAAEVADAVRRAIEEADRRGPRLG